MVFVPTPRFLVRENLEKGSVLAINSNGDPMPETLAQRFLALGGTTGSVELEGEICACWRFVDVPTENEYETTYRHVEKMIEEFKCLRGEELCSLDGGYPENMDFNGYTQWYIGELKRREKILSSLPKQFYATYEEELTQQRALYRAANRHPDISWWQYPHIHKIEQLQTEWEAERRNEPMFADTTFAKRKVESGFHVGMKVRTLIVPKGARTVPVPTGTQGLIVEDTDLYWMVSFPLPLTDCDGTTWLPHDEKNSLTIGYLTEEIDKIK